MGCQRTQLAASWGVATLVVATAPEAVVRAQELVPPLVDPTTPNIVGVAVGIAPDYLGSDDNFVGPAPVARYQWEGREEYIFLHGNALGSNVINHPWLRTGPTAIYRFGRDDDVEDEVVSRLRPVDDSLDVGWSIGAELIDPNQIARRVRVDAYATADVTGSHDGVVGSVSVSGWTPTPVALLGLYAGLGWASDGYADTHFSVDEDNATRSGLDVFDAGGGARDARVAVVGMVPVAESWVLGGGLLYYRLLGDAADSPIVADRGSADQIIAGVGVAFTW